MDDSKVSIIIPAYNVENYLGQCLDSVLSQALPVHEIILVDDGSEDGTASVCDSYAEKWDNIKVIRQQNRGQAAARNVGLDNVTGDYIGFVDADDFISPRFIEALFRALEKSGAKMATLRHGISFYDGHEPEISHSSIGEFEFDVLSEVQYQKELLYQKSWNGSVWRLCHASLYDNYRFPEGLYYEDLAGTYSITHGCGDVAVLKTCELYAYRQNEQGTMRGSYSSVKAKSAIEITLKLHEDISLWYPSLEEAACSRCFAVNRVVFSQVPSSFKNDRNRLWDELCRYRHVVFRDRHARKRERLAAGIALMGKTPFSLFCKSYRTLFHAV